MPNLRNTLVLAVLLSVSPAKVLAQALRLDLLPASDCETVAFSQEHWQLGHPPGSSLVTSGMPCIIGMPDPENRFALIKINGTVIRLIPKKDRGSLVLNFDSIDGKLRARIKVVREIDGLTTSVTYGMLTIRYRGQVLKSKVHNVGGS